MPTIPIVVAGSAKLQLKFLIAKTSPNPLPKFVADPINISLLTTSMLGTIIISTPMVVIHAPSD